MQKQKQKQKEISFSFELDYDYPNHSLHFDESYIEFQPEAEEDEEFVSEATYFVKTLSDCEEEKLEAIKNLIPNSNKDKEKNYANISNPQDITTCYGTKKAFEKHEVARELVKSVKKTVNKIIRKTGNEIKITKKKLDSYFETNSLEEIKKKKWEQIFASLHRRNLATVKDSKKKLKRKIGRIAFRVLMKLTFEEMMDYYLQDCKLIVSGIHLINLTGKFDTLKDVMKRKNKRLGKNKKTKNEHELNRIYEEQSI